MPASTLLLVRDFDTNRDFYIQKLGWASGERPTSDSIYLLAPDGETILLASLEAGDTALYLQENAPTIQPGGTLPMYVADADALQNELEQRGVENTKMVTSAWQYELYVPGPEHTLAFIALAPLSTQEILRYYEQGPHDLEAALSELSTADLDLAQAPGEWTIRQIVHHIADGDDLWAMPIKAALAASGAFYTHEWYTTDNACFVPLDYAGRPLEPALALFRATRAYTAQLLHHLPDDVWERYVMFKGHGMSKPQKASVTLMVQIQAKHALEHIAEIRQIASTITRLV